MLGKMGKLVALFEKKEEHPLLDARTLQYVIGELPVDNAFTALEDICEWLESMVEAKDAPQHRLFDAARQLEDAATPHLRRLALEYLHANRLSKSEEKRLWAINAGFWRLISRLYKKLLKRMLRQGVSAELASNYLPALSARLVAALRALIKWEQFHYGTRPDEVWEQMGRVMLMAEHAEVAGKVVFVSGGMSSAEREYQKAMALHAASMDSLLPVEIEIAEHFIAYYLQRFHFSLEAEEDSVYWVDLAQSMAPRRLAKMPSRPRSSQRFFKPGQAHADMTALLDSLERGGAVPADMNLGAHYQSRVVIPVLRHLCTYLSPNPPLRRLARHRVKHRMSVVHGLESVAFAFADAPYGRPAALLSESWVVENVSRGGFGAQLQDIPGEWLRVGCLLAMQPEGGDNWLLGCVRRYHHESPTDTRIGIETLAHTAKVVDLAQKRQIGNPLPAFAVLLLPDGDKPGEVRLVQPPGRFDPRAMFEYRLEGQTVLLEPLLVVEQTVDYELVRYRVVSVTLPEV